MLHETHHVKLKQYMALVIGYAQSFALNTVMNLVIGLKGFFFSEQSMHLILSNRTVTLKKIEQSLV